MALSRWCHLFLVFCTYAHSRFSKDPAPHPPLSQKQGHAPFFIANQKQGHAVVLLSPPPLPPPPSPPPLSQKQNKDMLLHFYPPFIAKKKKNKDKLSIYYPLLLGNQRHINALLSTFYHIPVMKQSWAQFLNKLMYYPWYRSNKI